MRKVLLIEPNYKNKYPPIGLMKLATYYRSKGDDVRFFKGDMKDLLAELVCEDLLRFLELLYPDTYWRSSYPVLFQFIKQGKYALLDDFLESYQEDVFDIIKEYRTKYKKRDYFKNPPFDKVGITTLFTFYWKTTIETINFAKNLCKNPEDVMVGGIMSSLLPEEVYAETGIYPFVGLLNYPGIIDSDDTTIIDELPLDYSILDEIDYEYPARNAYFAYMTRGCTNKCRFCAVPKLEPFYCDYISLKAQIEYTRENFGEQKDLLLMDNNVLASSEYKKIIQEIIDCGFQQGATYAPPNEYDVMIRNLTRGYNDRAYVKKAVKLYHSLLNKLQDDNERKKLYLLLEKYLCLYEYTATKENILALDELVAELFKKSFKKGKQKRIIDFNQGIEAKLVTLPKMKQLARTNIYPLRIAFDHWSLEKVYKKAIISAVKSGITSLSNYMLYNYEDKPEELYLRMRLNVELCEELGASIYSFPMKYHPINDPEFFKNRDYIGKHWNRKYIRSIQAILNSTKGKIGKGMSFFEEAFGRDEDEYRKLLWMPETFIIYRRKYDQNLRERLGDRYTKKYGEESDLANEWYEKFSALSQKHLKEATKIIALNKFKEGDFSCSCQEVEDVLSYYQISRHDVEDEIKEP